jgi:putative nucleotidyltransferase-like protein
MNQLLMSNITFSDFSSENELIICCSTTVFTPVKLKNIKSLLKKNINWDYFTDAANRHGVLPLVYQCFYNNFQSEIPQAVLKKLKGYYVANAYRNLRFTDELLRLLKLFEANGIEVVPFKGPILASIIYNDSALRPYADLDILIKTKNIPLAKKIIIDQKYRPDPKHQLDWEAHFVHEGGLFIVDLHWGFSSKDISRKRDASFAIDIEGIWRRIETVSFSGVTINHFSPEDLLMIRCQDSVKEYWKNGWPPLKWICDLDGIIRVNKMLDWSQAIWQAKRYGNQRLLFFCLHLTSSLMGTVLPKAVQISIQKDSKAILLADEIRKTVFSEATCRNRFLDRKRGFIERNLFCTRIKERIKDRTPYYVRLVKGYRHNIRKAINNKEDRDLLLLPKCLQVLYYPIVFFYFVLRPIVRIGRYSLSRMYR